MPSKGSRAASRQAQLKRKRRRGKGQPEVFAAGPIARPASAEEESPADSAPQTQAAPVPAQPAPQPVRRSRQRGATEPSVHVYLGTELRRIGMITALMVLILAVLTVVLR